MFGLKANTGVGLVLALVLSVRVQAHIALWDEGMYGYVTFTRIVGGNPCLIYVDLTQTTQINKSRFYHWKNSPSLSGGFTTTSIDLPNLENVCNFPPAGLITVK